MPKSPSKERPGSPAISGNRCSHTEEESSQNFLAALQFYRDHLEDVYRFLFKQAQVTYLLWTLAVSLCMTFLLAGLGFLILGKLRGSLIMTVNTTVVYYIESVFRRKEDHYSSLATDKREYLEYCNDLFLTVQNIQAIDDSIEREKRSSELVNVLIAKL